MRSYPAIQSTLVRPPQPYRVPALLRAMLAILGGGALFVALLIALYSVFNSSYSGKIYPGVSVAGIDLSGKTPGEAATLLNQHLDFPARGQIAFLDGAKSWVARPSELGVLVDVPSTVAKAYQVGREGLLPARLAGQLTAWYSGVSLSPRFVFDQRVAYNYLVKIASQVDMPVIEASLSVTGVDVTVRSGQVGRMLDINAALKSVDQQLQTLRDGIINLPIKETPPIILDVSAQADLARKILSAPLTISIPNPEQGDPGTWTFVQQTLAKMLTIERVQTDQGAQYQVGLKTDDLTSFLQDLAPKLARNQQNPLMTFNEDTKKLEVIKSAVIGRSLNVDASIAAINEKLVAGEHDIPLVVSTTQPAVTDGTTAEQLGISEVVSRRTSYFRGSSSARMHNIETASSHFNGVLVPPGATFSMGDVLGDVSLDTGYAEALIIVGNRTIQGVGGGVCQVSTTLFQTVFYGGYPVVERHPHAYRVGYYEQNAGGYDPDLAGLDATVFEPQVDFKFKNDSQHWLLMETYFDRSHASLTWTFYSTSDGRKVDYSSTGITNKVEPPSAIYEENPDLGKGEIKQVDWAVEGADVSVTRTVTRDGQVLYQDTFNTHYIPWPDIYQYGPGTEDIPTPEPTATPNP